MNTSSPPACSGPTILTDHDRRVIADAASEARAVLEAEHGYDAMSLAERVGALEWHLGEMLAAVAGLAAE